MNESFKPIETVESRNLEELRGAFEQALVNLRAAAEAVGKFEADRKEDADFGFAEDLAQSRTEAQTAFENLINAQISAGEKAGIEQRQASLL